MSITKVFNPRLNQYAYYTEENGQLIPLNYEDGLKQGLAVLEQIRTEIAYAMDMEPAWKGQDNYVGGLEIAMSIIDKAIKEQNNLKES